MLRGTLLNSYGWWTIGTYALYAAIGLAVAGLVVLGAFALEIFLWVRQRQKVAVRFTAPKRQAIPA
jgi:hypothetical protein